MGNGFDFPKTINMSLSPVIKVLYQCGKVGRPRKVY
jgi:hypothetical protein